MAAELLVFADGRLRAEEGLEALKRAMVASGLKVDELFSAEAEAWSGDPADDEGVDFDYSEVEWVDEASPSDWQLMQAAMANNRVTVRGDGGPEVSSPVGMPWETDREWT